MKTKVNLIKKTKSNLISNKNNTRFKKLTRIFYFNLLIIQNYLKKLIDLRKCLMVWK